jgi:hypothetical protein
MILTGLLILGLIFTAVGCGSNKSGRSDRTAACRRRKDQIGGWF